MGERLYGPFVFFGTLLAITAILVGLMSTMFFWADAGYFDYDTRRIQIGAVEYNMINATDGDPYGFYNVTWGDIEDNWDKDSIDNLYFHDDYNNDDLQLAMLRDTAYTGYIDMIYIFERWGWWSTELSTISYDTLETNQVRLTNASIVEFDSHGKVYNLIVITPSDYHNHSYYLGENEFAIGIAYNPYDPDNLATTSLWGILGQMLTAQLPNVHPTIQAFIAIPLWTGISFLFFTLISRVIPFISGG